MSDIESLTDAQLVTAYLAGDRGAFAGIYDRYADRLFSDNLTMLRDREDAADATHDTFIKAATRMDQLDSPDKLRPWLFAISRNEAHARGRQRSRTTPQDDLSETLVIEPDLALDAKRAELRELVWAAAAGLEERDRQLLGLHLTEGLEGEDLARAMGVETSHVHVMVSRMKDRVEKALGALLIARLGSEECDQLESILGDWDGTFDMDVRSRITRHVESCDICRKQRAFLLAPANVLPGIMVVPAPVALRARVLSKVDKGVGSAAASSSSSGVSPEWMKLGVFAVVALVVGLIGLAVSAQFEPLEPPPTAPVVEAPPIAGDPTTTTTSSSIASSSTTTPPDDSTTTTTAPAPAELAVSTDTVNFGGDGTVGSFELTNTGGRPGSWSLATSSDAIAVSATEGEVGPGDTISIDLTLDRNLIEEGDISETITVTWSEGQISIAVVGANEGNPILHNPQASPPSVEVSGDSACSNLQSTISVRVRDASPLESVVVRWSPDGSSEQETAMSPVGNDMFEGVVGPFTSVHTATVRIVAIDEHGNAGGATTQVAVVACP